MPRIANISSKLTLNTSNFSTKMQRARKATARFGKDIGRIGLQVGKLGAGMAVAGAAATAYLVKGQLAVIDSTGKMSDRIGIATEQLQGLRHAAELTGAGSAKLDQGLLVLQKRLGEVAQSGTGSAKRGLDMLGLSAEELVNLSPDQQLNKIADAMSKLDSQSAKVAATSALFSRGNLELVNTLAAGSQGLESMKAEAGKLGLALSRTDVAKVEAANDAITRMNGLITGAVQTLTVELAPFIEATAEEFIGLGTSGEGMSTRVVDGFEWVTKAVAGVTDYFGFFKAAFYGAQSAVTYGLGYMVKGWQYQGKVIESVINLLPGVNVKFSDTLGMMGDELIRTADETFAKSSQAFDDAITGKNSQAASAMFDNIRAKADASAKAIAANASNLIDTADAAERFSDGLTSAVDNTEQVSKTLADLQKQVDRFGNSDSENQLLDLKAMGATDSQLAEAKRLMGHLKKLGEQADIDATAGMKLPDFQPSSGSLTYTLAGSAEAQRLAYQASRGLSQKQDDTPKQQLTVQKRMAKSLETIERKGVSGGVTLQEFDI